MRFCLTIFLLSVNFWRAFDCGFDFADYALADFIFADTTFADYAFADSTFADLRLQITHLRIFKYGFAFADYQRIFRLKNFPFEEFTDREFTGQKTRLKGLGRAENAKKCTAQLIINVSLLNKMTVFIFYSHNYSTKNIYPNKEIKGKQWNSSKSIFSSMFRASNTKNSSR